MPLRENATPSRKHLPGLYSLVLPLLATSQLFAQTEVDTELVLLVNVSNGVNNNQFNSIMNAFGEVMTSSSILDAIQSGRTGSIAATVMFWSSANRQAVGVPWMQISDLTSASNFAAQLAAAARPFSGNSAIAPALAAATLHFGTETGGPENGFISDSQVITLTASGNGPPLPASDSGVSAARDAATAAGVDLINVRADAPPGQQQNRLDYYTQNVIGGNINGIPANVVVSGNTASFQNSISSSLLTQINAGAQASLTVVPEPSIPLLTGLAALAFGLRRRR